MEKKERQLIYNTDSDYCVKCLRAGYFKFGLANFLYHPDDGFAGTGVLEFDLEEDSDDKDESTGNC
jgi:hypothetical protein